MPDRRPTAATSTAGAQVPRLRSGLLIAVVVILTGWALHATASVSALIVASIFVAVVMAPLHRRVSEATGQRWVGHLLSFLTMATVLLAFAAGLFFVAQRVATEFPGMDEMTGAAELLPGLDAPGTPSGEGARDGQAGDDRIATGAPSESPENPSSEGERGTIAGLLGGANQAAGQIVSRLAELASGVALAGLRYATAATGGLVVLIFFALIMLIDAPRWKARLESAFGSGPAEDIRDAVAVMSRQLLRFVVVRASLGLVTAVLYMLWLWWFDVGLLFVWAALTFLLSFVPNLGSVVSGILPTIYAFLTKDPGTAFAVGAGLIAVEQVIGNYIDPRVQGRQVSVSPVVILAALLLFTWIWGVPGALLSTPVLIATVIGFARIEALRPVALLLSNTCSYDALDEAVACRDRRG